MYTSIRGKVGGIVYTKNQYAGLVARAFTAPTNPMSNRQELIRSCFSKASSDWLELDPADRDKWQSYAETLVYQGPHGTYTLPGRQVFISVVALNYFMQNQEGTPPADALLTPPVIAGFFTPGFVAPATFVTASSIGIALNIGNSTGEDGVAYVQDSIGWNQTKNSYHGPWNGQNQFCEPVPDGATTLIELQEPEPDLVYFTRVRLITDVAPHRISAEYILRHVSVENGP